MSTENDWVEPGVKVARVTDTRHARRVEFTKIERLTKTLAITREATMGAA